MHLFGDFILHDICGVNSMSTASCVLIKLKKKLSLRILNLCTCTPMCVHSHFGERLRVNAATLDALLMAHRNVY